MRTHRILPFLFSSLGLVSGLASTASAQSSDGYAVVYDRARGELSVGAQAPTRAAMVSTIRSGTPNAISAILEYGERVECHECVALLEAKLLDDPSADVRRMAAWWLRRRPFAVGAVMDRMVTVLAGDPSEVRRGRAADAIGELLDPNGVDPLVTAASTDASSIVRASSVRALGRLNHPGALSVIAAALEDSDVEVRRAALSVVLRVNFFSDQAALIGCLADSAADVRKRAALILGEMRASSAGSPLAGLLLGDSDRDVRQAAAWALGRIGGGVAVDALTQASGSERDSLVRDAIRIARQM